MLLPPTGWNGPGWISGKTIVNSESPLDGDNLICAVVTLVSLERCSISSSASAKSLPWDARYAWIVLCVLSIPGLPALSVTNDHTLAIIKNVIPYPNPIGSLRIGSHMSCGISTKNIANGWIKQIAHAFLRLAPNVVV